MPVFLYWPSFLWAFGLAEFLTNTLWLGPTEHTKGYGLFFLLVLTVVLGDQNKKIFLASIRELKKEFTEAPLLFKLLCLIALSALLISGLEASYPPHLPQEYDAINYHMGLPRQHLLLGSLKLIPWSVGDLFPSMIQWGYSTFWFIGSLYNKIPQFILAMWAFFLLLGLGRKQEKSYRAWIPALAFITTHGVAIQLGTAMLDLPQIYFLAAFLYAVTRREVFFAALHLALFASLKSFGILQVGLIGAGMLAYFFCFESNVLNEQKRFITKLLFGFSIIILLLLSRTIAINLERAGTPLFPFITCKLPSTGCHAAAGMAIQNSANENIGIRNAYGFGRGPLAFAIHLWRISVPNAKLGVNNEYDYPLGLVWLFWLVFAFYALRDFYRTRHMHPYIFAAFLFWLTWWLGSHQARWLYPVLALGWLGSIEIQKKIHPQVLLLALVLSSCLTLVSTWRAFGPDFSRSRAGIQEQQEASVRWDFYRPILESKELLYVNKPALLHSCGSPQWFINDVCIDTSTKQ